MASNLESMIQGIQDEALKMHIHYGQFDDTAVSACLMPGEEVSTNTNDLWGVVEKTLHLYPFLLILLEKLKENGVKDWKSKQVAIANWLGDDHLMKEVIPATEMIDKMVSLKEGMALRGEYEKLMVTLKGLNLVAHHIGVVALDAFANHWDISLPIETQLNLLVAHLNICAVRTVEYMNGKEKTWEVKIDKGRLVLVDKESDIDDAEKKGIHTTHKGKVIEKIERQQAIILRGYAGRQVRFINEFINVNR